MLLALSPQSVEKENLWDSSKVLRLSIFEEQTLYFPVCFTSSLEREKDAFGTAIYKAPQWDSPNIHSVQRVPKVWCKTFPTHQLCLCVSRLSHTVKLVTPGVTLLQHKAAAPSWALKGTRAILSLCQNICVGVAWPWASTEEPNFVLLREVLSNSHTCDLDQVWSRTNGGCHISLWHPDPHVYDQKHWIFLIVP